MTGRPKRSWFRNSLRSRIADAIDDRGEPMTVDELAMVLREPRARVKHAAAGAVQDGRFWSRADGDHVVYGVAQEHPRDRTEPDRSVRIPEQPRQWWEV